MCERLELITTPSPYILHFPDLAVWTVVVEVSELLAAHAQCAQFLPVGGAGAQHESAAREPRGNRKVARAWRGHGAGVARAIGYDWP
eukprot:gene18465-biopygen17408